MKAACLILLMGFYSCIGQRPAATPIEETDEANLSEIVESLSLIPLQTNSLCKLGAVEAVKRAGNNLFLLSNQCIYRFNGEGLFLNRIESADASICNFTVDTERRRLVAIDSLQRVLFYSYTGELLEQNSMRDKPWKRLQDLAYYNDSLWVTVERWMPTSSGSTNIEKWIYQLDASFNVRQGVNLCEVDLERFHIDSCFDPKLCVAQGRMYVYSALHEPAQLLLDTLLLIDSHRLEDSLSDTLDEAVPIMPLQLSERFLIASNQDGVADERYIFCYDRSTGNSFRLKEGFTDDIFNMGKVADLEALDLQVREFYYCKSGKDVLKMFPERTVEDNPVLCVARLKS